MDEVKVKLKIIRKLLQSGNKEDILLGAAYLDGRYGNKIHYIRRILSNMVFPQRRSFDIYTENFNLYITAGCGYIYKPTQEPVNEEDAIRI